MSHHSWRDAAVAIERATGPATAQQRRVAKLLRLHLGNTAPRIVYAALLRTALADVLEDPPSEIPDSLQSALDEISRSSERKPKATNAAEAGAWLTHLRLRRRLKRLTVLRLEAGDVVRTGSGELGIVASIGDDGCVWLKGGQGFRAWPDTIRVLARVSDRSAAAEDKRRLAQNDTAARSTRTAWSVARARDLEQYEVNSRASIDDVEELEALIDSSGSERPIQEFIERRPHILTSLLTGSQRYCIPQKRLGAHYVPDFLIADVDSLGVRWILVELETPRSTVYLKGGVELDKFGRRGISQIREWRNWLLNNLHYARNGPSEEGLGLPGISPDAHAIVLVGRRGGLSDPADVARRDLRRANAIEVHTYDWLTDRLRGVLDFQGPPGVSPFALQR